MPFESNSSELFTDFEMTKYPAKTNTRKNMIFTSKQKRKCIMRLKTNQNTFHKISTFIP